MWVESNIRVQFRVGRPYQGVGIVRAKGGFGQWVPLYHKISRGGVRRVIRTIYHRVGEVRGRGVGHIREWTRSEQRRVSCSKPCAFLHLDPRFTPRAD